MLLEKSKEIGLLVDLNVEWIFALIILVNTQIGANSLGDYWLAKFWVRAYSKYFLIEKYKLWCFMK